MSGPRTQRARPARANHRDPIMRTIRPCLALLLAAALTPAAAQDRNFYDVEIVLFENLDVRSAENERWQPQVVVPTFEGATAFDRGDIRGEGLVELPRGFETLPLEQARLGDSVERLEESERYRVIRHLHWRQPALEAAESVPLRFHAGEPIAVRVPADAYAAADLGPPEEPPDDAETDADTEAAGDEGATDTAATDGRPGADAGGEDRGADAGDDGLRPAATPGPRVRDARVYPLDGTLRLVVSRYLHLHADLYYTTAVDWRQQAAAGTAGNGERDGRPRDASVPPALVAEDPEGREVLSYPFVQQRRMRSGVLHYLDHPVIGLLVLVTPTGDGQATADGG